MRRLLKVVIILNTVIIRNAITLNAVSIILNSPITEGVENNECGDDKTERNDLIECGDKIEFVDNTECIKLKTV